MNVIVSLTKTTLVAVLMPNIKSFQLMPPDIRLRVGSPPPVIKATAVTKLLQRLTTSVLQAPCPFSQSIKEAFAYLLFNLAFPHSWSRRGIVCRLLHVSSHFNPHINKVTHYWIPNINQNTRVRCAICSWERDKRPWGSTSSSRDGNLTTRKIKLSPS